MALLLLTPTGVLEYSSKQPSFRMGSSETDWPASLLDGITAAKLHSEPISDVRTHRG
ncbi:hypothetical protein IWX65_003563 [Arthrobacter sp. CAN_A214]|uniref:hypothetical protein n=1 Tax=Arthrobacter sp. CAN_A214 TaxID=2787720 RepID=UPI0018CA2AA5